MVRVWLVTGAQACEHPQVGIETRFDQPRHQDFEAQELARPDEPAFRSAMDGFRPGRVEVGGENPPERLLHEGAARQQIRRRIQRDSGSGEDGDSIVPAE
jgi:hypothetical protein